MRIAITAGASSAISVIGPSTGPYLTGYADLMSRSVETSSAAKLRFSARCATGPKLEFSSRGCSALPRTNSATQTLPYLS